MTGGTLRAIVVGALCALALAGCETTGSRPIAEQPDAPPAYGPDRANAEALIGGRLLGAPVPVERAAVPDPAREQALLERWKHDRQFF